MYADLRDDARLAEELGYDTLWVAEHHFWYDGWCPQPLIAVASALAATSSLRVGTAMLLLPQHDVSVVSRDVGTLVAAYGDRLDLGVGLGYRDEEFDGVGVRRSERGRRMEAALTTLLKDHAGTWSGPPPVYVGGLAEAAIRRAGRHGAGLLLPNSLTPDEIDLRRTLASQEAAAAGLTPGRTGMLVDVWVTSDGTQESRDRVLDRLVTHYREYAGAWFRLQGSPGFTRPDLLDRQSRRTRRAAVVGDPEQVTESLLALRAAGVDTFLMQVRGDFPRPAYRRVMNELANTVIPELRKA
ncbi:LLM class flavin-dependent oxidoreductase [Actinomadura rugatobispora]|uniref:LLM class flavin-dependent oxidoreductase n=1 Tax=Actinomadura rugatobispora TaxID=1994 RepID=A0ABW1A1P2_9ACTN